jgi:hypothetical protein
MEFDWTQGALAEGLRHYNAAEYFTAHQAWETVTSDVTIREEPNVVAYGAASLGALSDIFRRYIRYDAL